MVASQFIQTANMSVHAETGSGSVCLRILELTSRAHQRNLKHRTLGIHDPCETTKDIALNTEKFGGIISSVEK